MKKALISVSVIFSIYSFAQETDSTNSKAIDEVVITGKYYQKYKLNEISGSLRLQTPIIELPQNVQSISSLILADQISLNMSEGVVRNVSGARKVEHWDNVYSNVFMRGASIATFMNGMNVSSTWGPINPDVAIIDRVEFVKGPAGFMGAMGDPSGFYNIVTKKPTGKFQNSVRFTTGSYSLFRGEADLDGVLIKNGVLDYRLNAMASSSDSWTVNDKSNKILIAPSLTFRPTKTTTFTAQYNYQHLKFSQAGAYLLSQKGYGDLGIHSNFFDPNFRKTTVDDHSIFLALDQKLTNDWTWSTQYAYMDVNHDGSNLWGSFDTTNPEIFNRTLGNWQAVGKNHIFQTYVRGSLQTGNVKHKLIAGFDYGDRKYEADFTYFGTVYPFNPNNPSYGIDPNTLPPDSFYTLDPTKPNYDKEGVKYTSYYIQDQIEMFNNKLRVTLAGRYTNGKTYAGYPYWLPNNVVPVNEAGEFTPRVGLSYSIQKDFSVYGIFDKTFTPQSGTGIHGSTITDPLKGQNIEFGLKKDWFNGKWNSTLAIYEIRRKNILAPGDKNDNGGIDFVVPTGEQKATGFEIDVKGEIVRGLNVVLNYAYTDAKVIRNANEVSMVGRETPGNAKNVQNTWVSYRFHNNNFLKGFGISVGYQYQGGRTAWFANQSKFFSDKLIDYIDTNFGVSYSAKRFDVNFIVNNVLNKRNYGGYTFDGDWMNPGKTPVYAYMYSAPRNWRISIGYKF